MKYNKVLVVMIALLFIGMSCKNKSTTDVAVQDSEMKSDPPRYSLAQWSFNRDLFGGQMTTLDFIKEAGDMGFDGVEYVSQFFQNKVEDFDYLDSLNKASEEAGVKNVMIMVDNAGLLGSVDEDKRLVALENHKKWVLAGKYLGCDFIRVNAHGDGTDDEIADAAFKSISELSEFAKVNGIKIIIENHGGISNNGAWLASFLERLKHYDVGALADPDNWCIKRENGQLWGAPCVERYDRYKGMEELMPYAKALSAKAFEFDENGDETTMDYSRMMDIIQSSGYDGYMAIEFEGHTMESKEGILKTKALVEKYWK